MPSQETTSDGIASRENVVAPDPVAHIIHGRLNETLTVCLLPCSRLPTPTTFTSIPTSENHLSLRFIFLVPHPHPAQAEARSRPSVLPCDPETFDRRGAPLGWGCPDHCPSARLRQKKKKLHLFNELRSGVRTPSVSPRNPSLLTASGHLC